MLLFNHKFEANRKNQKVKKGTNKFATTKNNTIKESKLQKEEEENNEIFKKLNVIKEFTENRNAIIELIKNYSKVV